MAPSTSAARPKRAGDDIARLHDQTLKKPRFDARNPSTLAPDEPEDDLILDADVIGKSGPQIKRNAVNIDGYESDSDNDNFNERAELREREKKATGGRGSKEEEEDDMFADLEERDGDEDEEKSAEGKKSKKGVRFLERGEVEGEVLNSTSGGHVSAELLKSGRGKQRQVDDDEEESSGEEEDRDQLPEEMEGELAAEIGAGGKKKHAPRLDAFNLKEEEEEGRYDESGNYVRKAADPDAANDSWLDGLTRKDMKKAKEAQEKRDEELRRQAAESDALLTSDLLSTLIAHLETGETALEALRRLNKSKPASKETKVPKWKQKKLRKDDNMDVDSNGNNNASTDPAETARRAAVDAITGAADAIYGRAQLEIYDTEREVLMRQYRRETGEDWVSKAQPAEAEDGDRQTWEFRWSEGGDLHGPYDAATMSAWREAGYFGEGVEFRRGGGEWSRLLEL
ncbi:uncharacterized protein LTR77_008349 [Saxophila tyrrhenica]|uniref:GYF domain-containing protein n=1 Tax=Saxophila tyrrhenica TaxID=1690608 RepID=A0AAV9P198_9PEZI|nr:hypothetical protein LTR77_008349 [Saxophila tyrrhenica]